jgi:1-acyl-sn-glycerol-3-phosphate acyltransferase
VGYHARFVVDIAYLVARLQCRFLVNHTTLQVPITSQVLTSCGAVSSNSDKSAKGAESFVHSLSQDSEPLIVLPGGSYECLKPLNEIGRVCWKTEPGFARAIIEHSSLLGALTRVVPFYTKNCERTAFISPRFYDFTGKISRRATGCPNGSFLFLGMMLVFLFSLGFPFLPRPVKLDTYFGEPLVLRTGESAACFALRVQNELQSLIDEVESLPERPYPRGRPGLFTRVFLGGVMTSVTGLVFGFGFLIYILLVHPFKMAMSALQHTM